MYQENSQRKWQTSPVSNPPLENLKTFIQKRIRAIMAKEWWDFIVNVNTLNSDHASLLYSLANLCPSFNYFLQTRDKELQLIIKKRPVVKPRIFSGSERLDTTPEPIVPKQLPLVTRRNSANELMKILNELYPNENHTKSKQPRTYGPASKQKKSPGPAKKNAMINNIPGEVTKKSPVHPYLGRTPLLKRLLADESQKENAHINNIKKMPQLLSQPMHFEEDEQFSKQILSNTNYDLNQNRMNQQSPRKIKKIIKVKKKRYVYSNGLATDSKHRLKYILEDETPNLSLKLIKKYRIKKCTVDVVRLKESVLKYYEDLRWRNYEKLRSSLEESSSLVPTEEIQFSASEVADQLSNSNVSANSPPPASISNVNTDSPLISNPNVSISTNSPADVLSPEKDEVSEKNVLNVSKESSPAVEKFNPRELKNMYCHGGIVPLGKLLMSDKIGNNKHFLSLKEKKLRDISNDAAIFLKPRDVSPKRVSSSSDIENKIYNSNSVLPDLNKTDSFESSTKENPVGAQCDKLDDSDAKVALVNTDSSNCADKEPETTHQIPAEQSRKSPSLELENTSIPSIVNGDSTDAVNETQILKISESSSNENVAIVNDNMDDKTESSVKPSNGNVTIVSETNEAPVPDSEKHLDINDVELTIPSETSDEAERSETVSEIDKIIGVNHNSEASNDSFISSPEDNKILEKLINDTLLNRTEELEPLPKRPRIEINLTEMKLVTEITKTLVEDESGNNDDRVCKMCKSSFDSVESWNEHFINKVPKCTPNLQVTWDNTQLPLLTD